MAGEGSITTMALVIHELATNSIKYGSLSRASGTLELTGTADDGEVTIVDRGGASRGRRSGPCRLRKASW